MKIVEIFQSVMTRTYGPFPVESAPTGFYSTDDGSLVLRVNSDVPLLVRIHPADGTLVAREVRKLPVELLRLTPAKFGEGWLVGAD